MSELLLNLDWRQPLWLLLALQPLLLWLILRRFQKRAQEQFAEPHLLPWIQVHENRTWRQRLFSRNIAYSLAWLFFAMTMAGPRLPDAQPENQNSINLDVMMVVDLSRSMYANDIAPTRLRRALLETYEFLSLAGNTRIGIVVYAARAHLFVPMTTDFKALKFYLKDLDTLQLPTQGSDASAALAFARQKLQTTSHPDKSRKQILLWLTDGDIGEEDIGKLETQFRKAKEEAIQTYILGLGTAEGSGVPLTDGSWLEYEGQAVISRMNVKGLQHLSQTGGGSFAAVRDDESDWKVLYQQGMAKNLPASGSDYTQLWKELYMWCLLPAIVLLMIALFPFSRFLSFLQDVNNTCLPPLRRCS